MRQSSIDRRTRTYLTRKNSHDQLNTQEPVLQDDLVNDLSTGNASPSQKVLAVTIELLVDHHSVAAVAFHEISLPDRVAGLDRMLPCASTQIDPLPGDSMKSCLHT